jgi:hypothetical protein
MAKKSIIKIKNIKHMHGTPNPILIKEENLMIAIVEKALSSTSNSQVIGRNGEIPFRNFLNKYLPYTIRAETGHFVSPSGKLSPQIDVMILDSRYPLLARNEDDSVVAMLHSLIFTIEIKTNITSIDIKKMWSNNIKIYSIAKEIPLYDSDEWGAVMSLGFSYKCANRFDILEKNYIQTAPLNEKPNLDIYLLRLHDKDQTKQQNIGAKLHFEPIESENNKDEIDRYFPISNVSFTPLSDLYYTIVQKGYYTLGIRNYTYNDIGAQVMNYLSWATCSWEQYWKMKEK